MSSSSQSDGRSIGSALASPDPTGSASQRDEFESEAYRRWERVRGVMRQKIEDDPRIKPDGGVEPAIAYSHFRHALQQAIDEHVLETAQPQAVMAGHHWTAEYIDKAWAHGIRLADAYLTRMGYEVADVAPERRMRQEAHRDGLRRERVRAYADLEDIAADTRKDASRTYDAGLRTGRPKRDLISTTDGSADGVNNRIRKVGLNRTNALSSVYIVGSINDAALTRYGQLGVEEVGGMIEVSEEQADELRASDSIARLQTGDDEFAEAEDAGETVLYKAAVGALNSVFGGGDAEDDEIVFDFRTANDDKVCSECQDLSGSYPIEEALQLDALPPIHINCRCFMTPTSFGPRIGAVGALNT